MLKLKDCKGLKHTLIIKYLMMTTYDATSWKPNYIV